MLIITGYPISILIAPIFWDRGGWDAIFIRLLPCIHSSLLNPYQYVLRKLGVLSWSPGILIAFAIEVAAVGDNWRSISLHGLWVSISGTDWLFVTHPNGAGNQVQKLQVLW
jgi:hypothetical protein